MARQYITPGAIALYVNETGYRQTILPGLFVNETIIIAAALAQMEAADAVSAAGTIPALAALAQTEPNDAVAATATIAIAGTLVQTESDDTVAATGVVVPADVAPAWYWQQLIRRRLAQRKAEARAPRIGAAAGELPLLSGHGQGQHVRARGGFGVLLAPAGVATAEHGVRGAGTGVLRLSGVALGSVGTVGAVRLAVRIRGAARGATRAEGVGAGEIAMLLGKGRGIWVHVGRADGVAPLPIGRARAVTGMAATARASLTALGGYASASHDPDNMDHFELFLLAA